MSKKKQFSDVVKDTLNVNDKYIELIITTTCETQKGSMNMIIPEQQYYTMYRQDVILKKTILEE